MKIRNACVVELAYVISRPDGEVLETSDDSGPLEYVHGEGELPPALEDALEGRERGDEVEVDLAPGEAFGDYDADGIVMVPRSELPPDVELVSGEWITVTVDDGDGEREELEMRIVEASAESVVLDANHPLASEAVRFQVRVLSVREG